MVAGIFMVALGAAFATCGFIVVGRTLSMRGRAPGVITGRRRDEEGSLFASVRFTLPDGTEVESETMTNVDEGRKRGKRVMIRYDPDDPSRMDLVDTMARFAAVFLFGMATLIGLIGLFLLLPMDPDLRLTLILGLCLSAFGGVFTSAGVSLWRSKERERAQTIPVTVTIKSIRRDPETTDTLKVTYTRPDGRVASKQIDEDVTPETKVGDELGLRMHKSGELVATDDGIGPAAIIFGIFGLLTGVPGVVLLIGSLTAL